MYKSCSLALGLLGVTLFAQAQTIAPDSRVQQRVLTADSIPTLITFRTAAAYKTNEAVKALREQLRLSPAESMTQIKSETDAQGFVHSKYQLYYQGVKVENATYSVHARQGAIESITGRLQHASKLAVVPTLTALVALKRATDFVGATQYMWQVPQEEAALKQREQKAEASYLPQGELVIVASSLSTDPAKQGKLTLAWKFDIFAHQPLSRNYIYVDAQTGEIVAQDAIIKSAVGPFDTRYSGTRSLVTDNNPGGGFRLRDYTRASGVETYNSYKTNTIGGAVDFVDADNNWTAAEYNNANFDNAAGDAHFGAQSTFDYWKNVHGRNSYDNLGTKVRGYVHFNPTIQSG